MRLMGNIFRHIEFWNVNRRIRVIRVIRDSRFLQMRLCSGLSKRIHVQTPRKQACFAFYFVNDHSHHYNGDL